MPYCPKCGSEYREGFITCSDCNSELVDKLEHPEGEAEPQYEKETFLLSVGGSMEADMIEALLNSNHIPVLKKFRDAGDYLKIYMGGTIYGVDIYVPAQLLGKAQEIVANNREALTEEELQDEEQPHDDEAHSNINRKRRIRTWIILLFFIPGIVWIIFTLIYNMYRWLVGK